MNDILFFRPQAPLGDEVLETAYDSVAAELEALAPEDLLHINLDIFAAVNAAAGVIPELKALRPQIARELPAFDLERFDNLHRYAMAVAYAHSMHLIASKPQSDLRPMFEEAVKLRGFLLGDLRALVNRGIVSADALKKLKGAVGYKNVQLDLQMLVNIFKTNWDEVAGRCAVLPNELARGEKLVTWLIEIAGSRGKASQKTPRTADIRARAFTLFMRAYDDARRAVTFLRWREGDADSMVPSLFAGRSNGRLDTAKKATEAAEKKEEDGEVNEPSQSFPVALRRDLMPGTPALDSAFDHGQSGQGNDPTALFVDRYPSGPYAEARPPPRLHP